MSKGRGENRRRSSKKHRYPNKPPKQNTWQPNCPICNKPVKNINIAIEEKVSKKPAHFECVIRNLSTEVKLGPHERLHYLGSGCFGIVKFEEGKGLSSYTIIRRIQYEDNDQKAEWRKGISQDVNK